MAEQLIASRAKFPYEFVLMLGDNLYSGSDAKDFEKKFEEPYKPLLDAGVKFYAALGNHDNPNQRFYKPFNMNGERFYTFKPKAGVRFFALDSNYMDKPQLDWLEKELAASGSDWKIAFFHHPLYSSGGRARIRSPAARAARAAVPEVRRRRRVRRPRALLRAHQAAEGHLLLHLRRRGEAARQATSRRSELTAKSFDTGYHFMLIELAKDALHFQVITDQGKTVDSGALPRFSDVDKKKLARWD